MDEARIADGRAAARGSTTRASCRVCLGTDLPRFLSLGDQPPANRFLGADQLDQPEPRFPLDVHFCPRCGQVQLGHVVPAPVLFSDYIYVSSTSETMRAHFARYADEVAEQVGARNPLVVEIASNDGCLLQSFRGRPVRVLGVEPAANVARLAERNGVPTVAEFFTRATAEDIVRRHGRARAIIGNNVLAHVDDLDDFCVALELLLEDDGLLYIEVPHLLDLVRRREFDTIYHEHLSYFALGALRALFERFDMTVVDVRKMAVHGGSLRVYVAKRKGRASAAPAVDLMGEEEARAGLGSLETLLEFGRATEQLRERVRALLHRLKSTGASLAGYGAAAKGNTLLNYCRIGPDLLDFIADRSPFKQGRFTPGMHVPVSGPERLLSDQPQYVLLLAWNFAEEIRHQQEEYRRRGGHFILPIPEPVVV